MRRLLLVLGEKRTEANKRRAGSKDAGRIEDLAFAKDPAGTEDLAGTEYLAAIKHHAIKHPAGTACRFSPPAPAGLCKGRSLMRFSTCSSQVNYLVCSII